MIREFHQIDLSGRNSFGVGQQAARLAEFETEEDLRTIFSGGVPERWAVLSGGNNILFTRDYDGLLLTPVARQITPLGEEGDTVRVRADAGVEWDDLVEWAVERGLWGIENLSLIPGKAGAAPVQNIGAYGCEAKDVIERVHMFCTDNRSAMVIDAGHCCFGYRESIFKHELRGRVIITPWTSGFRARPGRGWATATWNARSKPAAESRCATSAKRSAPSAAPNFPIRR